MNGAIFDRAPARCAVLASGLLCAASTMPAVAADASAGSGRNPATMLEDASLPQHVIYQPQSLKPFSRSSRLPLVVWGNGGCANAGNAARAFLTEIASHGYLVIASGPVRDLPPPRPAAAPAAPSPAVAPPEGGAPRVGPPPGAPGTGSLSQTSQLVEALDWATRENARRGSPYFERIDTNRVAAMGASCGGLQALEIGADPRVKTVVALSSGTLDYPRAGASVTRSDLQKLHGPVLYVVGGSNDIATPSAQKDYEAIEKVPVAVATNEGAGHGGTLNQENGGSWAPLGVAWLDWQVKGQRQAGKLFTGSDCGLCRDSAWKLTKKRL